jgi:hypothetical protein
MAHISRKSPAPATANGNAENGGAVPALPLDLEQVIFCACLTAPGSAVHGEQLAGRRCEQPFPTWLLSITNGAYQLSNHINNFNQSTTDLLYSGNTTTQNIAAGNGALAAWCVGSGGAQKIQILNSLLGKMGGDPDSLTDPCYRGADNRYYMKPQ